MRNLFIFRASCIEPSVYEPRVRAKGSFAGGSEYKTVVSKLTFCGSLLLSFIFIFFAACSSAPKRPAEVFDERTIAENQLSLSDKAAAQGLYGDALLLLEEARRLALATDDPSLRIRTSMSRADILFSLGRADEAFAEWENAAAEGDGSNEKELAVMARVQAIRARLLLLDNGAQNAGAAGELKAALSRETSALDSGSLAMARVYTVFGLAERQSGRWDEAEAAVMKALRIHEKERYLEDAAYDWYLVASVRSLAGNYAAAADALKISIGFDRRAENGYGLGSSWQALGDVYKKAGRNEEARAAFRRAAEIFRSLGRADRAEPLEKLL